MNPVFSLFLALSIATVAASPPQSNTASFHISVPPARALALFTAQGERAWAPGWEPQLLSGDVARGSVFRTHAHGRDTVWIVTDYHMETHRVSYARLVQDTNMGLVDVECAPEREGSRVTVRYTLTPLSKDAETAVSAMLEPAHYAAFLDEWRVAIEASLSAAPPR